MISISITTVSFLSIIVLVVFLILEGVASSFDLALSAFSIAAFCSGALAPYGILQGSFAIPVMAISFIAIGPTLFGIFLFIIFGVLGVVGIFLEVPIMIIIFVGGGATIGGMSGCIIMTPCLNLMFAPLALDMLLLFSELTLSLILILGINGSGLMVLFTCVTLNLSIILSICLQSYVIIEVCMAVCLTINVLTCTGGTGAAVVFSMFIVMVIISFTYCSMCICVGWCPFSWFALAPISIVYCVCFISTLSCFPPAALPFFIIAITAALLFGCIIIPLLLFLCIILFCIVAFFIVVVFDSSIFICIFVSVSAIFCTCQMCLWTGDILVFMIIISIGLISTIPALLTTIPAAALIACIVVPIGLVVILSFLTIAIIVVDLGRRLIKLVGGGM